MVLRNCCAFTLFSLFSEIFCAYQLITSSADVSSSKGLCADLGMQQVIIRDMTTYQEVKTFLQSESVSNDVWVGMYWDSNSQVFRWSDNDAKVVETINWENGEPNCVTPSSHPCNSGQGNPYQNCVRLVKNRTIYCDPATKYYTLCQTRTCDGTSAGDVTTSQQVTCEPSATTSGTSTKLPMAPQPLNQTSFKDTLYRVKKTETGSYRRQLTPAYDGRLSSKLIGLTGALVLVIVCSLFLAADMMDISRHTRALKQMRCFKRK